MEIKLLICFVRIEQNYQRTNNKRLCKLTVNNSSPITNDRLELGVRHQPEVRQLHRIDHLIIRNINFVTLPTCRCSVKSHLFPTSILSTFADACSSTFLLQFSTFKNDVSSVTSYTSMTPTGPLQKGALNMRKRC